jgi:GT2 family glycosyltransferase
MENSIVVSVVIVNWNAKRYLEECLSSLNEDVCAYPIEIIVVDNASCDGSSDMVREKFSHVRLIENIENLGFAKANNIGIKQAVGRYIALVNSDVHVLKDCLNKLVDHCEANPNIGMLGPHIIGGDGQQQRSCRGFPSLWNMFCRALALDAIFPKSKWFGGYFLTSWGHDTYTDVDILSGCFWLVRRAVLDDVGLLDESFFIYGEDMDWCRRFKSKGWPIRFFPEAQAVHYGGASSANAPIRFFIEKQRADFHYWEKHHNAPARIGYFAITTLHHTLRIFGYLIALAVGKGERQNSFYKIRRGFVCLKWMFTGRKTIPESI